MQIACAVLIAIAFGLLAASVFTRGKVPIWAAVLVLLVVEGLRISP